MFYIKCRRHYCSQKERHTDELIAMDEIADYDEAVQQLETMCAELAKEHIGGRICFDYDNNCNKIGATVDTGKLHECSGSFYYFEDYYELRIKHI